jgi:hypothetical protein
VRPCAAFNNFDQPYFDLQLRSNPEAAYLLPFASTGSRHLSCLSYDKMRDADIIVRTLLISKFIRKFSSIVAQATEQQLCNTRA